MRPLRRHAYSLEASSLSVIAPINREENGPSLQAALPSPHDVPEVTLREVIGSFYFDVLCRDGKPAKVWHSPTTRKAHTAPKRADGGQRHIGPSDVRAHLRGERAVSAAPLRRAIVLDVDLRDFAEGTEADEAAKAKAVRAVRTILDSVAPETPAVLFDSARGVHVWIRLARDPVGNELAAIARLFNQRRILDDAGAAAIEVYPSGRRALRLPLGVYLGQWRGPIPEPPRADEIIAWLGSPTRATEDDLRAIVGAAPPAPEASASDGRVQTGAARPLGPVTARSTGVLVTETGAPADLPATLVAQTRLARQSGPLLEPPASIAGWQEWLPCKQLRAVQGLIRPGTRHNTFLMLSNEAAANGERSVGRIVALLLALPLNGMSKSAAREIRTDAENAARSALKRTEAVAPILTSCGYRHHPHSGNPDTAILRQTFADLCTEERAALCPARHAPAAESTVYGELFRGTLFRGGQGGGRGLGPSVEKVARYLVRLSRGRSDAIVRVSSRFLAAKIGTVRKTAAGNALHVLENIGFLEPISADHHGRVFRLRALSPADVHELEERLGTAELAERERAEYVKHWKEQEERRAAWASAEAERV
jgi:hypothetical protein